jgi:alkylhydroperoxidase/carboxymuconolactone decarboxylase family protein YurZ
MSDTQPDPQTVLKGMETMMGTVPPAIRKVAEVNRAMLYEQVRSSAFAMPPDNGALDPQTRTIVYLAAALASSNHACTQAMVNKARVQGIPSEKLLEAFHIARFAMATRVVGDAEPLFEMLGQRGQEAVVSA